MRASAGPIERSEYERWLLPREVKVAFLAANIEFKTFGPRLMKRLLDGEVSAAAETLTFRLHGIATKEKLQLIFPALWQFAAPDDAFWSLAEIDIVVRQEGGRADVQHTLRGLKFDPGGIERMLGRPVSFPPPLPPTRIDHRIGRPPLQDEPEPPAPVVTWTDIHKPELKRIAELERKIEELTAQLVATGLGAPQSALAQDGPSVTDAEVRAWHATLSVEDKALGLHKLWRKARDDHPGRKLVRKLVEPFASGRKTGRKAKPR
jgi:hypothetical protein